MTSQTPTRTVLVGWSSGDWRVVSPLLDAGLLPHLAGLIDRGVCGNLASLWPDLPPLLWTSMATGKRPQRHGILGFAEPDDAGGIRPVTRHGRLATPLWSIASRAGLESLVVNFGPTWPADPITGTLVSNRFVTALPEVVRDPHASIGPGLVHPETRAAALAASCAAAMRVPDEILRRFLPGLGTATVHAAAVSIITAAVAEALAIAAMVRDLAAAGSWTLLAVRFSLVEQLADRFLMFHPPRGPGIDASAAAAYSGVIVAAHRLLDDLLGEIVAAAGSSACVAVTSDRGLPWTRLRAPQASAATRSRAAPCGIVTIAGPGITRDERIYGASILDVCPTLLRILGLPRGADMDGRVLDDAFMAGSHGAADVIPSWDEPQPAQPAIAAVPPAGTSDTVRLVLHQRALTLARCLVSAGDAGAAEPVLRGLVADRPGDVEAVTELAECLRCLDRAAEAVALLERLGTPAAADAPALDVLASMALLEAGRPADALARLRDTLARHGRRPDALVAVAQAEAALARYAEAEAASREALAGDPAHRPALVVLASALYRLDRYAEAAEAARAGLALQHFDPRLHLLMGTALAACGRPAAAVAALETAVRQAPGLVEAHERLATVHARQRRDFAAADSSRRAAREAAARAPASADHAPAASPAPRIVVVSGLPRSGTSLMMQMLAAGGIPPLTDLARAADEDNPRGYLEFEAVTRLARDSSWIRCARGRAVKVICALVPALPPGHEYRLILMQRDMSEVLASQRAMLRRLGAGPAAMDDQLRPAFARHLEQARAWCAAVGVPMLEVDHRTCLTAPAAVAARVAEFLGGHLDATAMAATVDASLWRHRS